MSYSELAQLEILNALNCIHTQSDFEEFKNMIAHFFASKAQQEIDKLWEDGTINEETVEAWGEEHF